jgi:hypothetical protein
VRYILQRHLEIPAEMHASPHRELAYEIVGIISFRNLTQKIIFENNKLRQPTTSYIGIKF